MPRVRRYYPASHNLNHDPEFIELRQTFGDWAGYVWHEILARADLNGGQIKGQLDALYESLKWLNLSKSRSYSAEKRTRDVQRVCKWMQEKGWIEVKNDVLSLPKYAEFHKSRYTNEIPDGNFIGSPLPTYLPNKEKEKKEKESTRPISPDRPRSPSGAQHLGVRRRTVALVSCPECGLKFEGEEAYFAHLDQMHAGGFTHPGAAATSDAAAALRAAALPTEIEGRPPSLTELFEIARQQERDRKALLAEQAARLLAEDAAQRNGTPLPPRSPELRSSPVSETAKMRISQTELNKVLDEVNGKVRH